MSVWTIVNNCGRSLSKRPKSDDENKESCHLPTLDPETTVQYQPFIVNNVLYTRKLLNRGTFILPVK